MEIDYTACLKYPRMLIIIDLKGLEVRKEPAPCPTTASFIPVNKKTILFCWRNKAILYDHYLARTASTLPLLPRSVSSPILLATSTCVWVFSEKDTAYSCELWDSTEWREHYTGLRLNAKNWCFHDNKLYVLKTSLLTDSFGCRFSGLDKEVHMVQFDLLSMKSTRVSIRLPLLGPFACVCLDSQNLLVFGGYESMEDPCFKILSENLKVGVLDFQENNYQEVGMLPCKLEEPCIFLPPVVHEESVWAVSGWQLIQISKENYASEVFSIKKVSEKPRLKVLWAYRECVKQRRTPKDSFKLEKLPLSLLRYMVKDFFPSNL